jgi:hypothetical protein
MEAHSDSAPAPRPIDQVEFIEGPWAGQHEVRVPHILAPDMDATIAAIEAAGGEIVIPAPTSPAWPSSLASAIRTAT